MITAMKVASCKVLLVSGDKVVRAHNHTDTGPVVPIIASLLLDETVTTCYVAGVNLYPTLAQLNLMFQDSVPGWRMRIANRRRHAFSVDGQTRVVGRFFVDYFAIDQKVSTGSRTGDKRMPRRRYEVMNLDLLYEKPTDDHDEQMAMALSLLEMCEHRGITMRGTKGALGSAMLKHSALWEYGRRSAPRFVNREARKYLPGNFYSVSTRVKKEGEGFAIPHCYYIDQTSAHHTIALTCPIPHPHGIRARGHYKAAIKETPKRWCDPTSSTGQEILSGKHHGLVLCKVNISTLGPTIAHLYPQWATKPGTRYVWLWTPEIRLFQNEHKLHIEHLCCSLTGVELDPVLPEYAQWCLDEIKADPVKGKHKKGALLSAYGMLAFNGENRKIYRYWGGENTRPKVEIPAAGTVGESVIKIPQHVELSVVNVIARGLIEAETRTRSIEYARELHYQGLHVPQIYADGLLVQTDALPFIPDNWRVSHSLTNVHIPRPNAIVSDQMVKLPGVAGNEQDREWERTREQARVIVGHVRELGQLTPVS